MTAVLLPPCARSPWPGEDSRALPPLSLPLPSYLLTRTKERESGRRTENMSPPRPLVSSPCHLPRCTRFTRLSPPPITRGWGEGRQHIETQAVCQSCSHVRA